ncbi:MAG: hypothetical protein ACK58T_27540, partial [Phycisphaerae bacterium]
MGGDAALRRLAQEALAGRRIIATGSSGSSAALTAAALAQTTGRTIVFVCAHVDDADEALDELRSMEMDAARLPALESMPGEGAAVPLALAERLLSSRSAAAGEVARVVITPIQALMQSVPRPATADALIRVVSRGQDIAPGALLDWLDRAGYSRVEAIEEQGEFALRGGIL